MTTIYRLDKNQLSQLAVLLLPLTPESAEKCDVDKLRILLTEWLMLQGFSCLHLFQQDQDHSWIRPVEHECDCCSKFRIGKPVKIPMIDGTEPPRRESQMMHFRGPWIAEKHANKRGKSRYSIRSHLLDCSSLSRSVSN